jgi:CheY-like chemotaxis protein
MRPKKVILCVDDEEDQLSPLKFLLVTHSYKVLTATSGQEAIAVFSAAPQIDLVLADSTMPAMNGDELVDRLKRLRSFVPMIILRDGDAPVSTTCMVDAVVSKKTCPSSELLERIRVMSAKKRGPRKGAQRALPPVEMAAAG